MSKIPEGATHTAPDKTYRRKVGKYWLTYADGDWIFVEGAAPQHYTPIQSEPEWSGEGLPQVGMVIEFMKLNAPPKENEEWTKGDVRCLSDGTIVIGGGRCEHVHHQGNLFYRPIRTPEKIEAEERNRMCDRIYGIMIGPGVKRKDNRSDMAEALYDAGLRFVEVTK